ncbi:hypothetical protein CRG98_042146 [Punica granatum]|uniref:Uncharacterized protein n=1 Tax=Punica granatum TaxID=22663 RepID=A0A2I0I0I7_PUNGR|nr:hypothetical protein CRG98_042146 [Punica granatum]
MGAREGVRRDVRRAGASGAQTRAAEGAWGRPGMGGRKSRGSVPESSDSVERLEGCSGAKDARSARMGAREDVRRKVRRAGVRGSEQLRVHYSPESTSFTRNEEINLK